MPTGSSEPTRRAVLASAAAVAAAAALPRGAGATARGATTVEAMEAQAQLVPDAPTTAVWSYGGTVPAPEIRLPQGARLSRKLVNRLATSTSIHWHGLRLPNAMDGVPGLTQAPVMPGDAFLYDFDLSDAGTYWFHSHDLSYEQVARGLHGALVVEEAEPPEVDRDTVLVLDDWRLDPDSLQITDDFAAFHDFSHAGRLGNLATTNGTADFAMPVRQNERLRLRLLNAATARIFDLSLDGLEGWLVALDGQPLATPRPVPEILTLAPAQRADLIVDVTAAEGEAAHLVHMLRGTGYEQARFPVAGSAAAARRPAPTALPANPLPAVDPGDARPAGLLMEGGAMRGMEAAVFDGRRLGFRELVQKGQFWAFNGVVGLTDAPAVSAAPGETVRLRIENRTAFPHAMHLHGHHMRQALDGGGLGPWRDTVLMEPDAVGDFLFTAGTPGKWALHCHMLGHAASGMMSWVEVTG